MTRSRVLWAIAILFALYAIYHDPATSGHRVQGVFDVVAHMLDSIFAFFGAILD